MTDVFQPLDRIALYAAAFDSDIHAERYLVVEDGRIEALEGNGIEIRKDSKPKNEVLNCRQCGSFMSATQLWLGACPKCGTAHIASSTHMRYDTLPRWLDG